jgi:GNAT superfamily N-acetyltransferase
MTLQIRPPVLEDRSDWTRLWAAYNAFYGRAGETALSAEVVETAWHRVLDPGSPVAGIIAEQHGRLVGLAHVVFHANLIQIADTCYLQDLFTDPEARGNGIARALIKGVEDVCRNRGVQDIYWHTHEGNDVARRLYDRVAQNTEFIVYRMKHFDDHRQ